MRNDLVVNVVLWVLVVLVQSADSYISFINWYKGLVCECHSRQKEKYNTSR
jgi:hypothetical protein